MKQARNMVDDLVTGCCLDFKNHINLKKKKPQSEIEVKKHLI